MRLACLWTPAPEPIPASQRVLLEVALAHSPLVEDGAPGLVYLGVDGLEPLYGDEQALAGRLVQSAADRGLTVRVGIAGSRIAAFVAARLSEGITVVPRNGEAEFLAPAPLALAGPAVTLARLPDDLLSRVSSWGVRTFGELAALPSPGVFERLGEAGLALQRLARGEDRRPFRRHALPDVYEESIDLEEAVDTLSQLGAILAELAGRIAVRLGQRGLVADRLRWRCRLADRTETSDELTPAVPLGTAAEIVPLLRAALDARPPGGPVEAVTFEVHPVRVEPAQGGLMEPPRPSPRLVGETLAQIAALVGAERVGIPITLDTYRPDALRLTPFRSEASPSAVSRRRTEPPAGRDVSHAIDAEGRAHGESPPLGLRRLRPPRSAAVTLVGGRPVHLRAGSLVGPIVNGAGPWRSSGEWWVEPWVHDEWDVELADGTLCRLAHDGSTWFLEGLYG